MKGPGSGGLLAAAENIHRQETGRPLLEDVPVVGLDDSVYPARFDLPPIAEPDEVITAHEMLRRLAGILAQTPAHEIVGTAVGGVLASLKSGIESTRPFLQQGERALGCEPDYLLIGYSQGSVVLQAQERWLAETGRLRGVVYLGNPLVRAGDPSLVSDGPVAGGFLRDLEKVRPGPAAVPRINYCLVEDFVCDARPDSAWKALHTGLGGHTRYFHDPAVGDVDRVVAAAVARMIA